MSEARLEAKSNAESPRSGLGHRDRDDHSAAAQPDQFEANDTPETSDGPPRKRRRHDVCDTQKTAAAAHPIADATKRSEPATAKRRQRRGHVQDDAQWTPAAPQPSPETPEAVPLPTPGAGSPRGRRRHGPCDTHQARAAAPTHSDGHSAHDTQALPAVAGEGHRARDAHIPAALAEIRDLHQIRRAHMLAAGDMERRIKSLERWAARTRLAMNGTPWTKATFPPVQAADKELVLRLYPSFHATAEMLRTAQREIEKPLEKLVKTLPVWPWVQAQRGFGALSFAVVVGEAGDIGSYANPGKLWKRMGLAVFDGKSQRKSANKEEALRQGYSPQRRSFMYVVGDCLIKAGGDYKAVYDARKAYEVARDPEIAKLHAHRRAQRYMEKRLLRNLWQAWRAARNLAEPKDGPPPADPSAGNGGGVVHRLPDARRGNDDADYLEAAE